MEDNFCNTSQRADLLKRVYNLVPHREGGSFSEVYTAPMEMDGRPISGSIYFLLDQGEISHFHEIDCDEIWFYHEGCGLKVTILSKNGKEECLLGNDTEKGERAMVVIPAGAIFAAENLANHGFTFISCITTPNFTYDGFRLVMKEEINQKFPEFFEEIKHLAY